MRGASSHVASKYGLLAGETDIAQCTALQLRDKAGDCGRLGLSRNSCAFPTAGGQLGCRMAQLRRFPFSRMSIGLRILPFWPDRARKPDSYVLPGQMPGQDVLLRGETVSGT